MILHRATKLYKQDLILGLFFILLFVKIIISYDISNPQFKAINFSIDGILLCILVSGSWLLSPRPNIHQGLILSFFFFVSIIIVSDLLSDRPFKLFFLDFPKLALPWLSYYFLTGHFDRNPSSLIRQSSFTAVLILILLLIGFLFLPRPLNKFHYWMPAYFSGLHKSAYVVLNIAFFFFAMRQKGYLDRRLFLLCYILGFLLLFWGWGVRSATLCLLLFPLIYLFFTSRLMKQIVFSLIPLLFLGILFYIVLAPNIPSYHDISNLSSGRLEMWQLKLRLIAHSDIKDFLLGRGSGTDFIFSNVWWWSRKDSHNDYMRLFYQYGLLGFVSYLFFVFHFFRVFFKKNYLFATFLLTYLFSGMISNGLFFRALPNYIFAIALVSSHFPTFSMRRDFPRTYRRLPVASTTR